MHTKKKTAGRGFSVRTGAHARFSRNLALARTHWGWTQGDLAEAAGIHRVQVVKYETEKQIPRLDTAENLAKTLGFSLAQMISPNFDPNLV